ncbi:fibronectin type III-like domain-contianing protein [Paenibacillus sp. BK720]|uniref:fibronectin type III-like domain-contianing protein n=1 Tax=Paenibacillus sp. BK720 TaxID=2587092 RepID=UPI003266CA5C
MRHFKRIRLQAGKTATVGFTLTPRDLRVLGRRPAVDRRARHLPCSDRPKLRQHRPCGRV